MMARQVLGSVQAVLIDLSGTLHIGDAITPAANTALTKLRNTPLKLKFVTNTTKEDVCSLHDRLTKIGFHIDKNEIYSSLIAARDYIRKLDYRPYLMLSDEAKKDFVEFRTDNPNAVVVGLAPNYFQYDHMNKAFNLILNGCPLIAIHKARYYKSNEGLMLGPGAFVQALEYSSDSTAIVVGKPDKKFFISAANSVGCDPASCVMIGDDVRDDVIGAINAGMQGILVKTGKYREGDEKKLPSQFSDNVASNFSEAVDAILDHVELASNMPT